jgi:outer membrane beta-barrel protein
MNIASRWMIALISLGLMIAATGVVLPASRVAAQDVEITGPLAGAPAVRRMRIYRDGRFQFQPTFGFTLNTEFTRTVLAGAQIGYHFTDWLGLQAFFDYGAVNYGTGLTKQIADNGQTTSRNELSLPRNSKFGQQVGTLDFLAGAQLTFIPFRGKLSLFQAAFVDTDLYLFAGAVAASVSERADVTTGVCDADSDKYSQTGCRASQTKRTSRIQPAPTFGVGLSFYITDFMGLTLEYRAFPFKWNTSGTDEAGQNKSRQDDKKGPFPDGQIDKDDRLAHFNQMVSIGLAFYLPFTSEITE